MPIWDELDSTREAQPEVLATLDQLLSDHPGITVHYCGYAHEPILRLLHRHLGTKFSVMDYPDRYSTGAAFFFEDGHYPGPSRPDWLEGVSFYHEGAPDTDLLIRDVPWDAPNQLAAIVEYHHPSFLLLADEACTEASLPEYSWLLSQHSALGTLTPTST